MRFRRLRDKVILSVLPVLGLVVFARQLAADNINADPEPLAEAPPNPPGFGPVVDFSGDGRADIAEINPESGSFVIRRAKPDGTFEPPGTPWGSGRTAAPPSTWPIVTGDFTGDGFADFAELNRPTGELRIRESLRDGRFNPNTVWAPASTPVGDWEVLPARVDGDRFADLLVHNRPTGQIVVKRNSGERGNPFPQPFAPPFRSPPGPDWRVAVADFTGDGLDDIADVHVPSGTVLVHPNTGRFDFSPDTVREFPCPTTDNVCLFGDYNGDKFADLADLDPPTGKFTVWPWPPDRFVPAGPGAYAPGPSVMGIPVSIPK